MCWGHVPVGVAVAALLLSGCGSPPPAEPKLELVPASGVVTLDGKPLADAQISFVFQGAPPQGFVASGATTGADGKFELKSGSKPGTVVGQYKVVISRFANPDGSPAKVGPEPGMDLEQLKMSGQIVESVPERYSSLEATELTADIKKEGENKLEFKLTGS